MYARPNFSREHFGSANIKNRFTLVYVIKITQIGQNFSLILHFSHLQNWSRIFHFRIVQGVVTAAAAPAAGPAL